MVASYVRSVAVLVQLQVPRPLLLLPYPRGSREWLEASRRNANHLNDTRTAYPATVEYGHWSLSGDHRRSSAERQYGWSQ